MSLSWAEPRCQVIDERLFPGVADGGAHRIIFSTDRVQPVG